MDRREGVLGGQQDCRAGIYLRISREDDLAEESASIANQRDFLVNYTQDKGWKLVDIYLDDGYSGTSFERPDFSRMLRDAETGRINTIITKDLSRLGRDYIGTGYYLEKYFPELDIRYVAVNDGIDTLGGQLDDMTPFRAVINDMYAKDISKKVRSVLDSKRYSGKFIGSFAPYGYVKDPMDRNRLIIDAEASVVVRRIFDLFIMGYGYSSISKLLNEEGIPCPSIYKASSSSYRNPRLKACSWTHETVRKILINPTYMGDMAQGKYRKVNYKSSKQLNIAKEKWIIVRETHLPIIDRDVFEAAQSMLKSKQGHCKNRGMEHLLAGLVYCGDCGARMTFHKVRNESYCICSAYRRFGKGHCTSHSVKESEMEGYLLERLKCTAAEYCSEQALIQSAKLNYACVKKAEGSTVKAPAIKAEIAEIEKAVKLLYMDRAKDIIDEEDFGMLYKMYAKEKKQLSVRLREYEAHTGLEEEYAGLMQEVKELIGLAKPDKLILSMLVENIKVYETPTERKIAIKYRFEQ